jgi:hypothetical protein
MNPLTVVLLPFLAYGLAAHVFRQGRKTEGKSPRFLLPAIWIRFLGMVIVLFGIVRNFPWHPFHLLAPGGMLGF